MAHSEVRAIPVSEPSTQADPHLPEEIRKSRYPFIQLIIQYLRAADRKNYEQRFYYFVGTTGKWVSEDSPRSDTDFNRRIKKALEHPKYLGSSQSICFLRHRS